jgi:hypothetical protein
MVIWPEPLRTVATPASVRRASTFLELWLLWITLVPPRGWEEVGEEAPDLNEEVDADGAPDREEAFTGLGVGVIVVTVVTVVTVVDVGVLTVVTTVVVLSVGERGGLSAGKEVSHYEPPNRLNGPNVQLSSSVSLTDDIELIDGMYSSL